MKMKGCRSACQAFSRVDVCRDAVEPISDSATSNGKTTIISLRYRNSNLLLGPFCCRPFSYKMQTHQVDVSTLSLALCILTTFLSFDPAWRTAMFLCRQSLISTRQCNVLQGTERIPVIVRQGLWFITQLLAVFFSCNLVFHGLSQAQIYACRCPLDQSSSAEGE